jgi:peptidyl-prolyl cis-trans isomerase C
MPAEIRGAFAQQMMPRFEQEAIDRFVTGKVLEKEASRRKIEVPDTELAEQITRLRGNLPPGMSWDQALLQMKTTDAEIRSRLTSDIKIQRLIESCTEELPAPTDAQAKTVYDEDPKRFLQPGSAAAKHILVKLEQTDDEAARKIKKGEAEALRKKLIDGADFAAVAKEHSDCPSKSKGGDVGEFSREQMVKPFSDAAFTQEIDAVGEVVETRFGYHIIKVSKRNEEKQLSFDEAKERISVQLAEKAKGEAVNKLITDLRATAKVTYGEGFEPPAAPPAGPPKP